MRKVKLIVLMAILVSQIFYINTVVQMAVLRSKSHAYKKRWESAMSTNNYDAAIQVCKEWKAYLEKQ